MVRMNPPHSEAVADVRDEDVDRYAEAGWTKVSSRSSGESKPTKKSTAKRSSAK